MKHIHISLRILMMNRLHICLGIILLFLIGCQPSEPVASLGDPKTCEGCHTNKDMIKALLEEDTFKNTPKVLKPT